MFGGLPGIANSAAMGSTRRRSKSRTHHALRRLGSLLPLRQVLPVSPDGQPTSGGIVRPLERFRRAESRGVSPARSIFGLADYFALQISPRPRSVA